MRIDYPMPQPAGLARYDGAGGVISLTTAPAFGVALPADPLESKTIGLSGEFRTIRYLDIDVSGVGVFATYDGVTPPTAVPTAFRSADRRTGKACTAPISHSGSSSFPPA
jgi:hypothetical protein